MLQLKGSLRLLLVAAIVVVTIVVALAFGYILAATPRHSLAHVHCPGEERIGKTDLCR